MSNIAVVTTFPSHAFDLYAKKMLESYIANWPDDISILVRLDDELIVDHVDRIIRKHDGLICGYTPEQKDFLDRNKGKDDPNDYRKQACRFSHKVFTLKASSDYWIAENAKNQGLKCRYLIWLDADVITTRKVTEDDLRKCFPKEGDAVSYMGRKDWDHSECGWLVFDLENGGADIIDEIYALYVSDEVFKHNQWHDSFIFDFVLWDKVDKRFLYKATNLTPDAKGMEVWPQSPMAAWSKHYKGPVAKAELANVPAKQKSTMQPLKIQTTNSIPNKDIQLHIMENQTLIKNWVSSCTKTEEEIVVVSAGPMMIAEDLRDEVEAGRKIVAVKHALQPLKNAGIKPWACILLDPRPHVYDFVDNPDTDIIWFVASQVVPKAVKKLLDAGCNVWGYHASVGADEAQYTERQPEAIVDGGSATATRGLFLLDKLGFKKFRLYGYDLCIPEKPNLNEKDEMGQPKYFEVEIAVQQPLYSAKRGFWSKGELLAQYEEFKNIVEKTKWDIQAFGHGIIPYMINAKRVNDLRLKEKRAKLGLSKPVSYKEMLGCKNKTRFWAKLLKA